MALSIDTANPEQFAPEPLNIDTGAPGATSLLPEIAESRAKKAQFGLGSFLNKSYDEVYQMLVDGREDKIRQDAAIDMDYKKSLFKQELIRDAAKRKEGPLTKQEADYIRSLSVPDPNTNPSTVLEVAYGKEYMDYIDKAMPGHSTMWEQAQQEIPEELSANKEKGRTLITKGQILETFYQNAAQRMAGQSTIGFVGDILKQAIPLYNEIQMRGNVEGASLFAGFGSGGNAEEQAKVLWRKPVDEFYENVKRIYDSFEGNPSLGLQFLAYMRGMGTGEVILNDAFSAMEIPIVGQLASIGKSIATKAMLANQVRTAVKGIVKSAGDPEAGKATAAAFSGDLSEAAVIKLSTDIAKEFGGDPRTIQRTMEALPTVLKQQMADIIANPGNSGQEIINRLTKDYADFIQKFVTTAAHVQKVSRVPAFEAGEETIRIMKENSKDLFPGLPNSILDINNLTRNPITNTYTVDLVLGRESGEYFSQWIKAKHFINVYGLLDATVDNLGSGKGFYVKITKPLDETNDIIRDLMGATKETKNPEGWINTFVGWLRTPEETLSPAELRNRKTATYSPSVWMALAQDTAKHIEALSRGIVKIGEDSIPILGKADTFRKFGKKGRWNDWVRVLEANQKMLDPVTKEPGYFFKGPGELSGHYQTHFKRMPTDVEVEAYFAYKRLMEMDGMLRDISVYRNKHTLGAESHRFYQIDDTAKRVESPFFDGMLRKEMPKGEGTILIAGNKAGGERLISLETKIPAEIKILKAMDKDVKAGTQRVIELPSPEERPLRGFGKVTDERIQYVITNSAETKPLSFNQVPRRGGGHWELDYDFYIKQAKIRGERVGGVFRNYYEGDTTIMPMSIRTMGKDVAEKLDKVRQLIKSDDLAGAKKIVDEQLHIEWDEVHSWFKPHKKDGVLHPPRINVNEPIQLVPKNKLIADMDDTLEKRYAGTFRDGTKQGAAARLRQVQFTGERDTYEIHTLQDIGRRHNPLYKYEPAKLVDPMTMMDRSLSRIIQSQLMDDQKVFSIEHWLRQASPYLEAKGTKQLTEDAIRANPYQHFYNPVWKTGAPIEKINNLKTANWQIQQFLGVPNTTDTLLHSAGQHLADSIYGRFGPKGLLLDPVWLLPKLQDPFKYLRAMTFHMKLGLFAVPQLWVQAQTYASIFGIAGPSHAIPGTIAAMATQWSRVNKNPAIISKLDEYLSKFSMPGVKGWKPGEFTESMHHLNYSGFGNVAGEYAPLDDVFNPKVVRYAGKRFLDMGLTPFREGEKSVRYGAWHTAYREFRTKNPTGKITEADVSRIQDRADLLYTNMSRASSSTLHSGVMSLTTQFLTYQLRAAELFMGKRLTGQERMRLFGVYGALYGVPGALGLTGLPLGDYIKQKALEGGYVVGDEYLRSFIGEGVIAMGLAGVTGKGDISKGNWYGVSERFALQGFTQMREAMYSDYPFYKIALGATGSTVGGIISGSSNFFRALTSFFNDDDEAFPMTGDDIVDVAREATVVHGLNRGVIAMSTGAWISKKESLLMTDVSPMDALFMTLSGLQPKAAYDINQFAFTRKDQVETEKKATDIFTREWRRGFRVEENNPQEAKKIMTRALILLNVAGIPKPQQERIIAKASEGIEPLIDKVRSDFYIKYAPEGKEDLYRDAYKKILKRKE